MLLLKRLYDDTTLLKGNDILTFAGIEPSHFRIYPIATHIAEKLHAYTMPRTRPNTRVKGLPDLALLASVKPLKATILQTAIEQTFTSRNTHSIPASIPDPPTIWEPVYKRMVQLDGLIVLDYVG